MKSSFHQYYRVRKYFVVNNGDGDETDPDLKPVVFSLPEPPQNWENIKNYGLHPDDQIYRIDEVPRRILMLEDEVKQELEERYEKDRNKSITGQKLLKRFWERLNEEAEKFKDEIRWMRQVIWKRYYGEWVFIDGQLIWLPPRFYMYLNFWPMSVKVGYALPEFRIRDWKSACVNHYLRHTKEGFGNLNKQGFAQKVNGKYEVTDMGVRTFYGPIRPKNRRSGATHEAMNEGHETVCTGIGKKATALSKSVSDVVEFFDEMLFPAWERQPLFLRPIYLGAKASGHKLEYRAGAQSVHSKGLDSVFYYVRTTDEVVLDSKRFDFVLNDEQGKRTGGGRVDVAERYEVSKQTLATGDGANIHGFCMNPSTAEEMEDGAKQYKLLCDSSNFYQRNNAGQTKTGLMLVYFPAQYCLEGFVDCFGKSVTGDPTDRQIRLTKKHFPNKGSAFINMKMGSKRYLLEGRNAYLKSGKPDDLRTYRQRMRKHPMKYAESWIGDSGDMGFPIVKIDARLAEADSMGKSLTDYGYFAWIGGRKFGDVEWVPLNDGHPDIKFEFSYHIKKEFTNKKKRVLVFNALSGVQEYQWGPADPRFVLGGDTFEFDNQSVAKEREDKSRKSDGGIGGYYPYDDRVDGGKDAVDWDSDRVILTYRTKPPSTEAYNEDLLMAAIYLGAWIYPERNIKNTWEFCIRYGYGGYLKYDINLSTGKPQDKPGYWVGADSKAEMFQLLNDYIERNAFRERHMAFLREAKAIRGPEHLKNHDMLAAVGAALMGARDMQVVSYKDSQPNRIEEAYKAWSAIFS